VPGLIASAAPGCRGRCAPEDGADRPKTTASISPITLRCMIWFFDGHVPDGHVLHIDILELALNSIVFATGSSLPLAM
jgi:prepilin-type processing-associated H-X9-DG protein